MYDAIPLLGCDLFPYSLQFHDSSHCALYLEPLNTDTLRNGISVLIIGVHIVGGHA